MRGVAPLNRPSSCLPRRWRLPLSRTRLVLWSPDDVAIIKRLHNVDKELVGLRAWAARLHNRDPVAYADAVVVGRCAQEGVAARRPGCERRVAG